MTQQHIVRSGETLSSIAALYSVDTQALQTRNKISNPRKLQIGQTLTIPTTRTPNVSAKKKQVSESQNRKAVKATSGVADKDMDEIRFKINWLSFHWLEELLQRLRGNESDEHVQKTEKIQLTPQKKDSTIKSAPSTKRASKGKRKLDEVTQMLTEALNKEPHVVTFNGVRLTENEKKQIVAAVACCEMNSDGFGSINADTEFIGRKYGKKGIETSYSRIVHIGLSYGVIQYTQDSGNIGILLKKMQEKNPVKFVKIFGGGHKEIAESVIALTTNGRSDLLTDDSIPLCGQSYWNKIKKTAEGKEIKRLSLQDENRDEKCDLPINKEIRGKRVQPIPAYPNEAPTDLWTGTWKQRFLDAGNEVDFQEAQLECAVEMFLNPILPAAKKNKTRSALGLAFVTACSVRGGSNSKLAKLLFHVAEEMDIALPFENSDDELRCIKRVAEANGQIGNLKFDQDESRRARRLIADELGFLAEDLYDLSTY